MARDLARQPIKICCPRQQETPKNMYSRNPDKRTNADLWVSV